VLTLRPTAPSRASLSILPVSTRPRPPTPDAARTLCSGPLSSSRKTGRGSRHRDGNALPFRQENGRSRPRWMRAGAKRRLDNWFAT
jgi:hypothetical protein